jgi:small-conductance mechanosensitive channel
MNIRHWITLIALLVLVIGTIFGVLLTDSAPPELLEHHAKTAAQTTPVVDQKPVQTARTLAALASSPEEQDFAHQALRLSDYEVDLAFADALREATEHPPTPTTEQRELTTRAAKAQSVVKNDQDQIAHLTHQLAAAPDSAKEDIQDQLDVAKAQLELDQDELDDANEDLQRAGGNAQGKIQRLLQEHEAGHADAISQAHAGADTDYQARNLYPQIRAWIALREKRTLLAQARLDALNDIPALTHAHDSFDQRVKAQEDQKQVVKQKATGLSNGEAPADGASKKQAAKDALAALHHLSQDQKAVSDLDKRIEDQKELAEIYQNWDTLIVARQRVAVHGILLSALYVLLILLVVYMLGRLIDRYFVELNITADKRRLVTLRAVAWFAAQAVGVLLIAFVLFGMPSQTPTVLGLAGAGLTVALKDFIVGFVGWFVLMGRNGIRVGDWVEINGVGGEVVEINLLRTTLLETGNWTDSGHPTGRKVTFVNSFAIEGHYFNFSTAGQWLWDELTVSVPGGQNPYPVIEAIQNVVVKETEENVHKAEEEWQKAATRYHVQNFSAKPAINLRPTGGGVEVHVRYITSAQDRQATRARLYESIVKLLHGKEPAPAASAASRA